MKFALAGGADRRGIGALPPPSPGLQVGRAQQLPAGAGEQCLAQSQGFTKYSSRERKLRVKKGGTEMKNEVGVWGGEGTKERKTEMGRVRGSARWEEGKEDLRDPGKDRLVPSVLPSL